MSKLQLTDLNISQIIDEVKKYLSENSYQIFVDRIKESVIGQDSGVEAMCLQIYKWLISISNGNTKSHNTILAAPSGTGKTAFYHAVKEVLQSISIPVINVDASSITPVGYTGNDYSQILDDFCAVNPKCQGIGICFLDELDKILIPAIDSTGRDFHKEAQSCLLKIIEGSEFAKKEKECRTYINTENTLFIGMGTFQEIREKRAIAKKTMIGFENHQKINEICDQGLITDEDIVNFGAEVEFIGRFEKIVNYSRLSQEALRMIIKKIAKEIAPICNISITFSENAFHELFDLIENNRGIRLIKGKIAEAVDKVLPSIFAESFNDYDYKIMIHSLNNVSYSSTKIVPEVPTIECLIPFEPIGHSWKSLDCKDDLLNKGKRKDANIDKD